MSSSRRSRVLGTVTTLAPVLAQTAKVVAGDVVDRLRPGGGAEPSSDVVVEEPAGAADYARRVHATGTVAASPQDVVALLTDLDRVHEWLTLHRSWRGERPSRMEQGAEFTQQISLMDIPAQARWTVARVDAAGFELRGTGPMGITVGLWASVVPTPAGSGVRLDGALDGPPVKGPVGLTAVRSVEVALAESLARVAELLGGAEGGARLRVADEPVLHERTGTLLEPTTPVVIGVGQVVQRTPDLDAPVEPVASAVEALRAAERDAGVDVLGRADLVCAVPSASWTYPDQAGLVASLVGAEDAGTVQTSPYGGDGGQLAMNDAADRIVSGEAHVVLVSGAEAGATVAALQAAGREPQWTRQPDDAAPDRVIGVDRPANNEAETSVGLGAPIYVYALIESALRGAAGTDEAEHRAAIADLWARHSAVAAENPYAWDPTARTAEEIATATSANRAVSDPYTKLMCANLQVDLAAGVVVTSVAAAAALGVPQEKWVFLHAGASATDEWFVSERADLASSPAIAAAGRAALEHAGVTADELGPVDLYSCFPAAVQLGAQALGLPWRDPARPLSVTGGLTSAGGPGNGYGLHAIATMVPQLRERPEEVGLSSSLGWYATKHALGVYSAAPPSRPFAHLRPTVDRPAPRPVVTELEGEAVVEAVTVSYDRDGRSEGAVVAAITADGTRVLMRRESAEDVALLTGQDPVRRTVRVEGERLVVSGERRELPAPPARPGPGLARGRRRRGHHPRPAGGPQRHRPAHGAAAGAGRRRRRGGRVGPGHRADRRGQHVLRRDGPGRREPGTVPGDGAARPVGADRRAADEADDRRGRGRCSRRWVRTRTGRGPRRRGGGQHLRPAGGQARAAGRSRWPAAHLPAAAPTGGPGDRADRGTGHRGPPARPRPGQPGGRSR